MLFDALYWLDVLFVLRCCFIFCICMSWYEDALFCYGDMVCVICLCCLCWCFVVMLFMCCVFVMGWFMLSHCSVALCCYYVYFIV